MSTTDRGILVGAVLALAAVAFGFWAMILVALFMAIGVVVARMTAGEIDVRNVVNAFKGRSTS